MTPTFLKKLAYWFRLLRWNNLFIIALTMILVRYALIHPLFGKEITHYPLTHINFFLLIISLVFIAGGGYIINDYFDVKIDRINRPERMILGRYITFNQALSVHQIFSGIGIILGFYVGYKVGSIRIGGIQAIMVAVLWYYSYRYKGLFIWGNLVVSILSGMAILLVWLFEFYALQQDALAFGSVIPEFKIVNRFIISYFIFSFLLSFAREIIKDVGDIPGDSQNGCNTLAVKLGVKSSLKIAAGIMIITLILLIFIQLFFLPDFSKPLLVYSVVLLDLPLAWLSYKTYTADETTDTKKLARFLKLLMLSGIISMIFITL